MNTSFAPSPRALPTTTSARKQVAGHCAKNPGAASAISTPSLTASKNTNPQRDRYPTFAAFFPRLIAVFAEITPEALAH